MAYDQPDDLIYYPFAFYPNQNMYFVAIKGADGTVDESWTTSSLV
jgi:hypothetical protein